MTDPCILITMLLMSGIFNAVLNFSSKKSANSSDFNDGSVYILLLKSITLGVCGVATYKHYLNF